VTEREVGPRAARRAARHSPQQPHPLIAAALSAIVPGAGQLYAGERRRGWVYLTITAIVGMPFLVLFLLVFFWRGLEVAISVSRPFFENPNLFNALAIANALLLVFRAVAVVDAYLIAAGRRSRHRPGPAFGLMAGLGFLLFLSILPHGFFGRRALLAYEAATHDFVTDPGQGGDLTDEDVLTINSTPTTTSDPAATSSSTSPTTSASTMTTTEADAWDELERLNVVLLGGDAGVGRTGIRTDTIMVASIDPATGYTALFSISRGQVEWPIPEVIPAYDVWDCHCFPSLANEIYQYGLVHPELFPGGENSGANAIKAIVGQGMGLDIQYFALVDLNGFVEIIDTLGGVEITLTERLYDAEYPHEDGTTEVIDIAPGTYLMDGHTALAYARTRRQSDDYNRMNRQRCLLEAVAAQADPVTLIREFPQLLPAVKSSVRTDIPVEQLPDLLELLPLVQQHELVSIRFVPDAPEFAGTPTSYIADWSPDRYPIPDFDLIRTTIDTVTSLPPDEAIAALNLQTIDEACG
jgi:LCP family protein required for cell wall assembly